MAVKKYDEYRGIPQEFLPTRKDEMGLSDIVRNVKDAIRIRHDFNTAVEIAGQAQGERRLRPIVPKWESAYAQSARPDAKTMKGLAAEHKRLAQEAQAYVVSEVRENPKLARILRENLRSLFPDIGYSESTGEALQRLHRGPRTVLSIFDPLGVEGIPD